MSPIPLDVERPIRVLVTGYGGFRQVTDNPSWRAVAPLHNVLIRTASNSIHVTVVGPLKVAYKSVLDIVPGLYARPPRLPPLGYEDGSTPGPAEPPPPEGYHFIFHVGLGHSGDLSIEQVGHKSGYQLHDVDGQLAPIISSGVNGPIHPPSAAQQAEAARLGSLTTDQGDGLEPSVDVHRGFTENYEHFPESLYTEVDVNGLIEHLRLQGETRVRASTDAGYYLCDYITYCGLAESQRTLYYPETTEEEVARPKSLFMHVPPKDTPHTLEEMTEAVQQVLAWVCTGEKALPE